MKNTIINEAMALPADKRAELADMLLQSLHHPADRDIDQQWIQEAEKRYRDIKKGKVKAISADRVFGDIHRLLSK